MLNNNNKTFNYNTLNFNSVSGTIVKSHPDSVMEFVTIGSREEEQIFSDTPRKMKRYESFYTKINVLQTMLCGDGKVLVEYVFLEGED